MKVHALVVAMLLIAWHPMPARADASTTQPSHSSVIVFPFAVIGNSGHSWVGKAFQQGLVGTISGASAADPTPADNAAAVGAAKGSGAAYVLVGACQFVDDQMRVTAQLISVHSGKTIARLHRDAELRDLFDVEDTLARQVNRQLAPVTTLVSKHTTTATLDLAGAVQAYQPRYFQTDIRSELALSNRFQDQYDHYNLSPYPACSYYGYWGYPCYGGYGGYGGGIGPAWGLTRDGNQFLPY